jgi:hypothetical protein
MASFFKLFHTFLSISQCIDRFKNIEGKMILLKFGGLNMPKYEEEQFPEDEEDEEDPEKESDGDGLSGDEEF